LACQSEKEVLLVRCFADGDTAEEDLFDRAMESVIFSLLRNRPCCKKRICTEAITAV
jgi:hypothetical protein